MTRKPSILSLNRRHFLARTAVALLLTPLAPKMKAFAAEPVRGGTLRVSVDQAASVIHPLLTRVNPEYMITELLYSNLTRLRVDMIVEPDLALSWVADDSLTNWTFKLREGVTFHDGSPLTSHDVVATFKAIFDPDTASPGRKNVGPIEEIVDVDSTTAEFKFSSPYSNFPVAVAYTDARIIPAAYVEDKKKFDSLSSKAVGTGPFKLVSYEPDRKIVFERNPDYYDPKRPYVDGVEISVFPDSSAEGSAFLAGDTDLMQMVRPTE